MRTPFSGVGTALITPFTKDGALDEAAVRRLARRQIDAGIHFLSPCGTTGEAPTLTHREKLRVVEIVVEESAGRVPVLAGAGGYDTREVIELARDLERVGVDGLLSVTPYYNKPTQEGLYQHFKAIAAATSLPIVLYNVPGRTAINLEVQTVVRLSAIPNIVAVKEASANVVQMCDAAVYGPSMRGNYRRLLDAVAAGRFVPIGRGTNQRTLVYEDDAAAAFVVAAGHPGIAGKVYNVTDGERHSVAEILDTMSRALGRRPPRVHVPLPLARTLGAAVEAASRLAGRPSPITAAAIDKYVEHVAVAGDRIRKDLGICPRIGLEEGWRRTVDALKNSGALGTPRELARSLP